MKWKYLGQTNTNTSGNCTSLKLQEETFPQITYSHRALEFQYFLGHMET